MAKNLYKTIEDIAREEIDKGNFRGAVNVLPIYESPRIRAKTSLENKTIEIDYNSSYETDNPGKTSVIARDVTRHEIDHHGYKGFIGCPKTAENHVQMFFEPMADVLLKKGFTFDDVKYMTNALQDSILHRDLNQGRFSLQGISYFFEEIGNSCEKDKETLKNKFTPFYEAHAKLNMHLWGNRQQKKSLQKFYTHNPKITEVMKKFLERTKDLDFLKEQDWSEISKIYAEEFSALMEPGYALPIINHSGAGTRGRESKPCDEEGNYFDKEMKTRSFKQSRVEEAYANKEKTPLWIDNFEAMDMLYESMARKLNLIAKSYTKQKQMPIFYYGKRDFDPEKDDLKHVFFDFDDKGNIELKKKRFHEDIPISVKRKEKGFPEMRFGIFDTSSSMKDDVYGGSDTGNSKIFPWGDKSKYHYALLSWYGFLEYLKQNYLLEQSSVNLANFSSQTLVGKGLKDAKEIALTPQFGTTTNLDLGKIREFFEGRDNLIFTISDGQIFNWENIKDEFIKNATKHHYFHLQIGGENETTQAMKDNGLRVEYITDAQDLANKTIDLTDKLLRKEKNN